MRDILVHATRHDAWSGCVQYAAHLAAYLKASLTALHSIEPTSLAWDGALGAPGLVLAADADLERKQAAASRASAFRAWASSFGVAHSAWVVHDGDPVDGLAHLGHWHDLLVLGRGGDSPWESGAALAEILMDSRLPCIVVPGMPDLRPFRPLRIAVAWDGSLQAVRALHAAVPLLETASQVVVLMDGPTGPLHVERHLPHFDLHDFCERHALGIQYVPMEPNEHDGAPAVLAAATRAGADLLVMGAFGHARLRERLFGGTTQQVLRDSQIPVLLRH